MPKKASFFVAEKGSFFCIGKACKKNRTKDMSGVFFAIMVKLKKV